MYIIGNWKMNGSLHSCEQFIHQVSLELSQLPAKKPITPWIATPFPYLHLMAQKLSPLGIRVGAQNCFHQMSGAYTGEVSPQMIQDVGGSFVIVGHSERRLHQGESSAIIQQKCQLAQATDLPTILCIGEPLEIREKGDFLPWLSQQLQESLPEKKDSLLIAYEPIWSIGTGKIPTPQQILEVVDLCRQIAPSTPILYGGSVSAANLREIMENSGVDGVLVGGASLKAVDFLALIREGAKA